MLCGKTSSNPGKRDPLARGENTIRIIYLMQLDEKSKFDISDLDHANWQGSQPKEEGGEGIAHVDPFQLELLSPLPLAWKYNIFYYIYP